MASRTRIPRSTLKRDAKNRAWRTFLQTVGFPVIIVLIQAATAWAGGGHFDPRLTLGAAIVAAGAPLLALLQRLVLDPSPLSSATPPTDTIVAARTRGPLGEHGHAGMGTVAGALLVIVVILLAVRATLWLTGGLAVLVVVLLILALLL